MGAGVRIGYMKWWWTANFWRPGGKGGFEQTHKAAPQMGARGNKIVEVCSLSRSLNRQSTTGRVRKLVGRRLSHYSLNCSDHSAFAPPNAGFLAGHCMGTASLHVTGWVGGRGWEEAYTPMKASSDLENWYTAHTFCMDDTYLHS